MAPLLIQISEGDQHPSKPNSPKALACGGASLGQSRSPPTTHRAYVLHTTDLVDLVDLEDLTE
eukprot:CAMPEP_0119524266 /NCGR_PEP_ID=MMETSP1344-20130328/39223_1 /TAXON_ID=236787 /ORGANISM="Florenciella parvula, Strain CCMP2471" /LENGTH=62 /DNA_ID=CAMNT_0007562739 /DNA_START=145 /DNA_END=333 /DNA_ORIENTATION=+